MSDLAPFVAAALRDRVVQELMEENRELKQTNQGLRQELCDDRFKLQITGRNGTPVYGWSYLDIAAKNMKKSAKARVLEGRTHQLRFRLKDSCLIPWRKFENDLEIRLGKVVLGHHRDLNFPTMHNFTVIERSMTRDEHWYQVYGDPCCRWGISGEFGPRNRDDTRQLYLFEEYVESRDLRATTVFLDYADIKELVHPYLVDADGR